MKKIFWWVLTLIGITGGLCAQQNGTINKEAANSGPEKVFETDPAKVNRRFWIDLGKGNRLRLELQSVEDLDHWENLDSLLLLFANDLKPFSDSLSDELSSHRIDYVVDMSGRKKLRIQQFRPSGSSFLLESGELSALKVTQDTINILLTSPAPPFPKWDHAPHRSRLTLYLNQYHDLESYLSEGLNGRIGWIRKNLNGTWINRNGVFQLEKDPAVTATAPRGMAVSGPGNDYLASAAAVGLGNYKNYFVPSFAVGFSLHFNRPSISHEIDLLWEPNFVFQNNAQGHLQTWRNDFLTVAYSQEKTNGISVLHQLVRLSPSASLSYLIRREGEYFDKNTFRLGMGGLRFFDGGLTIEPCLYFSNFFQQTTPGVRLQLAF